MRNVLLSKIVNPELLEEITPPRLPDIRLDLVKRLDNEDLLEKIALEDNDTVVRGLHPEFYLQLLILIALSVTCQLYLMLHTDL